MNRIYLTVTNDLTYDQRMSRICSSLAAEGWKVTLVGRKKRSSTRLASKPYRQKRIFCFFEKGKLFYLEYNFRLCWFLLFARFGAVCAIDLDTILPCLWAARLKGKKVVYDAHEYFTEMEEIVSRPRIHKAWQAVERYAVPKVDAAYTVSEGYARMFNQAYGVNFGVVRNATVLDAGSLPNVPGEYILYQGAVNVGRGLEALVEAMHHVKAQLYICGKGDIYKELKAKVAAEGLHERVRFQGYVPPEKLKEYTRNARIGITLFSSKGLHHQYSLANRFFDYMHAGVPQIATDFPEYAGFNKRYEVARLVHDLKPESIAAALNELLTNQDLYYRLRGECARARLENNWQTEEQKLLSIWREVLG